MRKSLELSNFMSLLILSTLCARVRVAELAAPKLDFFRLNLLNFSNCGGTSETTSEVSRERWCVSATSDAMRDRVICTAAFSSAAP